MKFVEPKRSRVVSLLIGLSGTTNSSQITDQLQRHQRIVIPSQTQSLDQRIGRRIRNHMKEEIKARISGGEERHRHILREAHGRQVVIGVIDFVEVRDQCIDEGVSGGG